MAEWLKAHAWKACLGETLTWVRIPLSPPLRTTLGPSLRFGISPAGSDARITAQVRIPLSPPLRTTLGPSLRFGISPAGSDARITAQVRIPLSPPLRTTLGPSLRFGISPAGSDARITAQVRIPLSPPLRTILGPSLRSLPHPDSSAENTAFCFCERRGREGLLPVPEFLFTADSSVVTLTIFPAQASREHTPEFRATPKSPGDLAKPA